MIAKFSFNLSLVFLLMTTSVSTFGKTPLQSPKKNINEAQTPSDQAKRGDITLSMLDGPNRLLADMPKAPTWVGDKNWLRSGDGDDQILIDAETGEPAELLAVPYETENVAAALVDAGIDSEIAQKIADSKALIPSTNEVAVLEHHDFGVVYRTAGAGKTKDSVTFLDLPVEKPELCTFNHDETQLAFVTKRGLNVFELKSQKVELVSASDADRLLGKLDWVYQEELYGRGNFKGFWWQPTGNQIAFLELDEAPLIPFTVMDHLPVHGESEATNYPKAGDPNPGVRIGVLNSTVPSQVTWVQLPQYEDQEILISAVTWSEDGTQLLIQVQNREQTWLDLVATDSHGKDARLLFRDKTPAWIESPGDPVLLEQGQFIWRSPRSGYSHLYRYEKDGSLVDAVTAGDWEVRSLIGVDAEKQFAYFTATKDSAVEIHGYRANLETKEVQRLTELGYSHELTFNDDKTYFIDEASSVSTLPTYWICQADGTKVRQIGPDQDSRLDALTIGAPEFLTVPMDNGQPLDALLLKPNKFDPAKKYPVLVHVYGGPQTPRVLNRFRGVQYLWHQMLAQQGYLVFVVDNQSASYRSVKNAWPIHRGLAQHELADIEHAVEWLKQNPWIDSQRVGIWGWSYGGYLTAYALTHSKTFKAGISGAPVTDWKNYDSIYTERYMGTPQNNPAGYESSSVLYGQAKNLYGKLLLIHGTIDDNVHLNNSLQFMKELQDAGKQFETMFYPSNRHSIKDKKQAAHLRKLMTDFVLENL
jgi:dipeptidyl-peptidase-4